MLQHIAKKTRITVAQAGRIRAIGGKKAKFRGKYDLRDSRQKKTWQRLKSNSQSEDTAGSFRRPENEGNAQGRTQEKTQQERREKKRGRPGQGAEDPLKHRPVILKGIAQIAMENPGKVSQELPVQGKMQLQFLFDALHAMGIQAHRLFPARIIKRIPGE